MAPKTKRVCNKLERNVLQEKKKVKKTRECVDAVFVMEAEKNGESLEGEKGCRA